MKTRPELYNTIGYMRLQRENPSFALPLFRRSGDQGPSIYVQEIDEITNLISDFRVLADAGQEIVVDATGPQVSGGREIVYVFIDENNDVHAGNIRILANLLRAFASKNPQHTSVNMQIEELIGDAGQKRSARLKMREVIKKHAGEQSAYAFYHVSVLKSAFWDLLIKSAKDVEVAKRIIKVRSRLDVFIDDKGKFQYNLNALAAEDRTLIDTGVITDALLEQFEPSPDSYELAEEASTSSDQLIDSKIADLTRHLEVTGRQEERIAILLDRILNDRNVGLTVLNRYVDKAQFANWAISQMKSGFERDGASNRDELVAASFVSSFFTRQYPLSRGELLYFLAKHLSKWPAIRQQIREKLSETGALSVEKFRPEINKMLGGN